MGDFGGEQTYQLVACTVRATSLTLIAGMAFSSVLRSTNATPSPPAVTTATGIESPRLGQS